MREFRFLRMVASAKGALLPATVLAVLLSAAPVLAQQTPAPAADSAATAAPDPETTVVATVDGEPIYLADILAQIQQLPQQYQKMPLQQIYAPMLDRAIDSKLISHAARKEGLQDRADVKAKVAQAEDDIISQAYLTEKVSAQMDDEALRKRYEETLKTGADQPEEVKARHILVATEDEAKAIIEQLKKGADFAKLATEKSTGPSGASGGDLGYFTADAMVEPFSKAAFALKPGEFTQTPVKTQFGWHVILVEDRRKVEPPKFEEVKQDLAKDMTREILTKTVDDLRKGVEIKRFAPDGTELKQQ